MLSNYLCLTFSDINYFSMKPIVDIVNIFVTDDRMFNAVIDLPEKANFINAVTAVVTGGHFNQIRRKYSRTAYEVQKPIKCPCTFN